jgi:hypothetical protein
MDRLRDVLGRQSGYLARALEVHAGLEEPLTTRFMQIAGADLIESYRWASLSETPPSMSFAHRWSQPVMAPIPALLHPMD